MLGTMRAFALLILPLGLIGLPVSAQSNLTRELETLRKQRDKAIETAIQPINEKYIPALDALLQKSIKAGDVDAAARIKAEIDIATGEMSPAFVVGVWKVVDSEGRYSLRILDPGGKAFFIGSDGKSYPNVWKIDGRKLIVGPADDRDGRFTGVYTVDGNQLRGEGGNGESETATRVH